jgi:hypothetical protein|tara:strand:- start:72 stop:311 length:240 start_codon:yes stop_codon:yes gene_type:complete
MSDILKIDGFDKAIIGVQEGIQPRLVYDLWKIVDVLTEDMSEEDALDYIAYNITGAYVGESTPVIVDTKRTLEEIQMDL